MDDWLAPFSGTVPHPPGTVCGALCTPWCTAAPAPDVPTVPEPRSEIAESGAPIL
jgi:hypothetical protein